MEDFARWRWFVIFYLISACHLGSADEGQIDPKIIDSLLQSKLELTPGNPTYEAWQHPKDHYFEVFLFNWTNADKFPAKKPHLKELGPYRFREHREQVNVTWDQTKHTLSYRTFKRWVFDETSPGKLDDLITTVDYITDLYVHLGRRENQSDYDKTMNAVYLVYGANHSISVTKTARELLFEGYDDVVLEMFHGAGYPGISDKFGWFYGKNNSLETDGYLEVTTGESVSLPGQIVRWNLEDHLKHYKGNCSKLEGSMGDFLPHDLTEHSKLKVFMPGVCRPVAMPYISSGQYRGLNYHKYGIAPSSFDKADSDCYDPCEWGGVINGSACNFNAPTFISLPHFLHGDPRLSEHFQGLHPDAEKHSFYYSVEPKTGIPFEVAKRHQMNVYMEPDVAIYANVPRLLFPVYWVQELVSADQQSLERLLQKNP